NISPWLAAANPNNSVLREGGAKIGIATVAMQRNVRGCWNLGSCGMGCPTNAKQSMLVTTIPTALDRGARLLVQTRAERFELGADGRLAALVV
ncbi:GMC family oxidoreductase N-terminal domain-containing protein, partial [Vibrio parahaemolyticus]|nr:GMC family oxidoreductase N-terminal domain-containing protein [Vibrio parahaemolyticus]